MYWGMVDYAPNVEALTQPMTQTLGIEFVKTVLISGHSMKTIQITTREKRPIWVLAAFVVRKAEKPGTLLQLSDVPPFPVLAGGAWCVICRMTERWR
jgi:hypothetical protein